MSTKHILLSLVQGDEGKEWARNKIGWDVSSSDPVCDWDGVTCNSDDSSTLSSINFRESKIIGTLPSELGKLTTLISISLPTGNIRGTIPTYIANLPHLEVLNLARNAITGTIPTFHSPKLRSLDLGYNLLTGRLPNDFGFKHDKITDFDIIHNKVSGQIPSSLQFMSGLVTLSLSNNCFTGTIPSELGTKLALLRYLYMDHNYLMGTIPPSIARVDSRLVELWLQENLLSGTIPVSLADVAHLKNLYVDGNKFTGSVPFDLCRPDINVEFFKDAKQSSSRDYCQSVACPTNTISEEGVFPCVPCQVNVVALTSTTKYYNPYLGRVGNCIDLNQRDILISLHETTNGKKWVGISNWAIEDEFLCHFTGITCDPNNHITGIDLKGRGLTGSIPESIGFLPYLSKLDLSDNDLTGFLPSDLRWAPLEILDVSGNMLRGIVPNMLCRMGGINGNGVKGDYNCENIACPAGYFSISGRRINHEENINEDRCRKCADEGSGFLGSKNCYQIASNKKVVNIKQHHSRGDKFMLVVLGVSILCAVYWRRHRKRRNEYVSREDEDFIEIAKLNSRSSSSTRRSTMDLPPDPSHYKDNYHDDVTVKSSESDDIFSDEDSTLSSLSSARHVRLQREGSKKTMSSRYSNINSSVSVVSSDGSSSSSGDRRKHLRATQSERSKYSTVSVKSDEWSVDAESTKEDWLDVPNI